MISSASAGTLYRGYKGHEYHRIGCGATEYEGPVESQVRDSLPQALPCGVPAGYSHGSFALPGWACYIHGGCGLQWTLNPKTW